MFVRIVEIKPEWLIVSFFGRFPRTPAVRQMSHWTLFMALSGPHCVRELTAQMETCNRTRQIAVGHLTDLFFQLNSINGYFHSNIQPEASVSKS